MKFFKHLFTVMKHRHLVRKYCFKCGLILQGLTHDLSKYSFTEFWTSVKYFQGNRSPTIAERKDKGYSKIWMHHKGRNKHHFEYWTDYNDKENRYVPLLIPKKYLLEMFCDRIAASKVYLKKDYKDDSPLNYYLNKDKYGDIHPKTREELEFLLNMLASKGEKETFKYIKENKKSSSFLKNQ